MSLDAQSVLQGRVRSICAERRITSEEIASSLNLAAASFINKKNGNRKFTVNELVRLADIFGVSVDYLLGRDDDVIRRW